MDAIAIKESAEAIKTLAAQIATKVAPYPNQGEAQELIKQIAFQADCILNWFLIVDTPDITPPIDGERS